MDKVVSNARAAVEDVPDGASLAVGGFGLSGVPFHLIAALFEQGATDLVTVSNNCGVDGWGLGTLLDKRRIRRTIGSYVGENREFERQYLSGDGGSGIPAFYTPAGVGTPVADGGLPLRYARDGTIALASPPKETRSFDGRDYVLEHGIVCDYALVRASVGDRHGNLIYHKSTRNFNPLCAMAGRITIAEVEELVEPGEIDPELVHTPGIFVQRVVNVGFEGKRIERVTVRERT